MAEKALSRSNVAGDGTPGTPGAARGRRRREARSGRGGFTLFELLVVVAVLGVLAGLLLPALGGAKARGQAAACLNHHRQLMLACSLYVDDHEDAFPYNLGDEETRQTVADRTYLNWVNNVMSWELDPENTNRVLATLGGLGPYTSRAASLYRCPVDRVVSDTQREAGWRERVRSVSMNAMVGDAGHFTTDGANLNNPHYRQFFRASLIPEPSRIFVLVEEHPDSINDGYFLNKPRSDEWIDLPASYHGGGGHLAFADGHVEYRRWRDSSTRPPARPDVARLPFEVPADEGSDYAWLMQRTSVYGTARTPAIAGP